MQISQITGTGTQTVEALKHAVADIDESITSITDALAGEYNIVETTLEDDASSILIDVPASAHVYIMTLECGAGGVNSSVTVRFRDRSRFVDITRINNAISTSQAATSFAVLYAIHNGHIIAATKQGVPIFLGSISGSVYTGEAFDRLQLGIVVDAVGASIPAGTTFKIYYR